MTHTSEGAWVISLVTQLNFLEKAPDVGLIFANFFKCSIMYLSDYMTGSWRAPCKLTGDLKMKQPSLKCFPALLNGLYDTVPIMFLALSLLSLNPLFLPCGL